MSREVVETALTPSQGPADGPTTREVDTLDDEVAAPDAVPLPRTRRALPALAGAAGLVLALVVAAVVLDGRPGQDDPARRASAAAPSGRPSAGSSSAGPSSAGSPTAESPAQEPDPGPSPTFVGASGAAVATLPVSPWLRADVAFAGRDGADLGRVQVTISVSNSSPDPLQIGSLTVLGLGTVLIPSGTVETLGTIAPNQTVRVPASVIADCTVRVDPSVAVIVAVRQVDPVADAPSRDNPPGRADEVTVRATTGSPARVQSALDAVCPPMQRLLAVSITGVRTDDDGSMTVRLVNHGYQSATVVALAGPDAAPARIVTDPPLPFYLAPGEAVTARLRISVPGCAVPDPKPAAAALSLEARIPWGFTQVGGWPEGSAQQALEQLATQCRERRS